MRRNSPFLLAITMLCFALVLGDSSFVNAQDAHDKFWRSYSEFGVRAGDTLETGQGNLFVPLHQSEVNMLFADVRGNWTDARSSQGNFGLAFRQMLIHDWLLGVNGFYDIRHSEFGNNFHRASVGAELLNQNWGLRWNSYFANEDASLVADQNSVQLIGNELFVREASERAYSGHDFEVESRLFAAMGPNDDSWRNWYYDFDVELWGSIGYYSYENDATGFEDVSGPRARLELRIFDVPMAGPDSRLVIAGQFEDDDVRGDVSSASLTMRIPFGRGSRNPRGRLNGLNRRMVAPIVRNNEIVTVRGFGNRERAAFDHNGREISQVVSIDGTTVGPEGIINGAGANSLVVANGSEGTITTGGSINLQTGQAILGGGSSLLVRGVDSGAVATFTAAGTRPLFDSIGNTTFVAAEDSFLTGLSIVNSGANQAGVFLNGVTGVLLDDLDINVSGSNSIGVQLQGASLANLLGTSIGTSGNNADGISIAGSSFLSVSGSQVFTSGPGGSQALVATDSAQLVVSSSTLTTTGLGTDAITATPTGAADVLSMQVTNSTINATGNGIVLGGAGFTAGTLNATVANNVIASPTGANEIDAETNGAAVLNLSAANNSLAAIVGTIRLDEIGGDINVTQSAGEIASANGLSATNVLTPSGAITFDTPPPAAPAQ